MEAAQSLLGRRWRRDVAGAVAIAATGRSAPLNAIGSQIGKVFVRFTIPQTGSSAFRFKEYTGLQTGRHARESVVCGCTQAVLYAIRSGLLDLYPSPPGLLVHFPWRTGGQMGLLVLTV